MRSVVPHVGTWIEICRYADTLCEGYVVPHVGTWIEILHHHLDLIIAEVVPHVGTWIEINNFDIKTQSKVSRSSRRNVD